MTSNFNSDKNEIDAKWKISAIDHGYRHTAGIEKNPNISPYLRAKRNPGCL